MSRKSSWGTPHPPLPPVAIAPNATITQAEIEQLHYYRRLNREHDQLRDRIRERLQRGAAIEPGPFRVRLEEQTIRSLSASKLTAMYGAEWVKEIQALVEPTVSRRVVIDHSPENPLL